MNIADILVLGVIGVAFVAGLVRWLGNMKHGSCCGDCCNCRKNCH